MSPIATEMETVLARQPKSPVVRFPGSQLGGVSVEDAYVYRQPTDDSATAEPANGRGPSWFTDFVEDTVDAFRRLQGAPAKQASFEKRLDTIRSEHVVVPTFIGHVGERFIHAAVQRKGYAAVVSAGSRSPADLWGYGTEDGVSHIPLLQVKATREDHPAAELSADDERELSDFALFVADAFVKSNDPPQDLKASPLLVSAGYAGVVIDWLRMGPTKYNVRCLGAAASKDVADQWARWGPWLDAFYQDLRL